MCHPTFSQRHLRSVRLDSEQITEILDGLDGADRCHAVERRARRFRYRMKGIVVHMHPLGGGSAISYLVPTRDLGAGGFSFLHGAFMHPGTECVAQLITSMGNWQDVNGKVVACRHVDGSVHLVALSFFQELDPSVYCVEAAHSRVLLAEDDPLTARLAIFLLEKLNATVHQATDGRTAVDLALERPFDVVLMDMEMPVLTGFEAVKELRERGYRGLIVALTALTRQGDLERCLKVGCDHYLAKPFTRADLANVLHRIREEPLFSNLVHDQQMVELINVYVESLSGKVRAIEQAVLANDSRALTSLARVMKGQGTGYGFEVISDAAAKLENSLIEEVPMDALRGQVDDLARLCTRAHVSARVGDSGGPA